MDHMTRRFVFGFVPVLVLFVGDVALAAEITPVAAPAAHLNRLAGEKLPYLQQHAANPVDWYPWGEEAFAKARRENKPIFLSIGYSTCHWCHVMERESFTNPDTAAQLNAHFVCIKVDREERPDLDRVYMAFVLAATGRGGWPMSVWLTPDLKPFLGGTYFPPENREGRPGFRTLIHDIAEQWAKDPATLVQQANQMLKELTAAAALQSDVALPIAKLRSSGLASLERSYDKRFGGFGGAPKFPNPVNLEFLVDVATTTQDKRQRDSALQMVVKTLREMSAGGIHDQLAGGFHRYATDDKWRVPHFEKMLYDQAQIVNVCLSAWQLSGDRELRDAAEDTLRYVRDRLTGPDGGFYSAEDADSASADGASERREGAYYVWTADQIAAVLSPKDAEIVGHVFGVTGRGNAAADPTGELAGTNVLYRARSSKEAAAKFGVAPESIDSTLHTAMEKLLHARELRPRPPRDDKVITAWNGLMISAFARAAQIFGEPAYAAQAEKAAQFLRDHLYDAKTHRLSRSYRDGVRDQAGFAEDSACLIQGLLDVYETTFDVRWLSWAIELQETQIDLFEDKTAGGFFANTADDATVMLRLKEDNEGAEPTASSIAVRNLARLSGMLHRDDWRALALRTTQAFAASLKRDPLSMPQMLASAGWLEGSSQLILVQATNDAPGAELLMREVNAHFLPRRVLVRLDAQSRDFLEPRVPGIHDFSEQTSGPATAYVCENFVCNLPTSDSQVLVKLLNGRTSPAAAGATEKPKSPR
jgi:uncharacterized protein YyaL (SSP411 family)